MDYISLDTLDKVPAPVLAIFAGIGALFLGVKAVSYVRLLLSLFVINGKSVCFLLSCLSQSDFITTNKPMLTPPTASNLRQERHLGSRHRRLGWHRKRIRYPTCPERFQSCPDLSHRFEARDPIHRNHPEICWLPDRSQDTGHGFFAEQGRGLRQAQSTG